MKLLLCLLALTFTACTLAAPPDVPLVPETLALQPAALAPEPVTVFLAQPVERVEMCLIPELAAPAPAPAPVPHAKPTPPVKAQTPAQLVQAAAIASRVEPSATGYFAGSAEQVYVYQPGKVFSIYLTPSHATGIFLPPGERQTSSLVVDPEAFDIKEAKGGTDATSYGAILIRPTQDKGEVEAVLLTESGRRYLLRLIMGSVGMTAVSFEIPTLAASEPILRKQP